MLPRLLPFLLALLLCPLPLRAEPATANWTKRYDQAEELLRSGKVDESIVLGKETVALADQTPSDPALISGARYQLAQLYLLCHRFPEAERTLTEIVTLREKAHGMEDLRVSEALYDLAWFYSNMSNYARAEPLFLRVLAIDEKNVGRRHARTALALNSLGVLNENKGDYAQAEKYFLEALAIQRDTIGAESTPAATTINNLATLYWIQGDYRQAETFFSQALTIRERVKGRGSLATATTVNNLALVYLGMGDYARAETLFWRVLRIREQKLGVSHPLTLTSANHLGLLYYDLGDYAAAESFLQRAALGREKVIGADQPDTARAIFHLACLYDKMGQFARAEPLHRRALDIRTRILGEKHPETAASYGFLARHYHLSGQLEQAAPLYAKALDLQRTALGPYHPDLLKTVENEACLQLDRGDHRAAAASEREASVIREHLLQNLFIFTSEKQRIDYQKTLHFYNLTASLGDATEISRVIYRTKGVVLDSVVEDRVTARSATDPEIAPLLTLLQETARKLEKKLEPSEHDKLEREVDRLQAQIGDKLGLAHTSRRALQTNPATIAAAVPAHAALVEFIRYEEYTRNLQFRPAYGALVQAHGQPAKWVKLGNAETIDTQVRLYQKHVRRRVREAALEAVLQRLHELVWQPLEPELGGDCQRVIVSPDADLNFISFATLLHRDNHFLCENLAVEYVSSARDLLRPTMTTAPDSGKIVVFSAPDFGVAFNKSAANAPCLSSLPGTQKEATFLQREAGNWGLDVESFAGAQASEAHLKELASPLILHLATHGFYWGNPPAIPPPAEPLPGSSRAISATTLQRSFLALSGAQTTLDAWQRGEIPPAETDGVVTADEAGALSLSGTWLVVLSACDTGMGAIQPGEGVLGLRRGFLLAGAQNLVMSLWPVGDAETVTFMEAFYRAAIPSRNAAQALTEVQRTQLLKLRQEKGLWQAVRSAGPFILCY